MSPAWDPKGNDPPPPLVKFKAVWDTGATNSMITQAVIDACGLKPVSTTTVSHALGDTEDVEVFLVNIGLPNGVGIPVLRVAKAVLKYGDILIGMDIITAGDFAVTNRGGFTKFSFRIPPQADIDFFAEEKKNNLLQSHPTPSNVTRQKNREQRRKGKRK